MTGLTRRQVIGGAVAGGGMLLTGAADAQQILFREVRLIDGTGADPISLRSMIASSVVNSQSCRARSSQSSATCTGSASVSRSQTVREISLSRVNRMPGTGSPGPVAISTQRRVVRRARNGGRPVSNS